MARLRVMDDLHGASVALCCDPGQVAREDADAIAKERTVRGVVHVGLDDRGIGAKLPAWSDLLFARLFHDAIVNGTRRLASQEFEQLVERGEIGCVIAVEAGELAVHEATTELAFQFTEGPALQVLEGA